MNCPYCLKKMEVGSIQKDRYSLKWVSDEDDKGILNFTFLVNGIKLISNNDSKIKVFYCCDCRKFIIDQDDL